jgi:hypothetical protein
LNKRKVALALVLTVIVGIAFGGALYFLVSNYFLNTSPKYIYLSSNIVTVYVSGINISPTIYSPQKNIAILNDQADFNVTVANYTNESIVAKVSIIADDRNVYNCSFDVSNGTIFSKIIYQRLYYTGLWIVTATSNDTRLGSAYSFMTVTNVDEANSQINALENTSKQQNSNDLANTLSIISIVSSTATATALIVLSILPYRRKKANAKKPSRDLKKVA